ncbi:MAG: OsmC family protein [Dethiobacter sp.]|jgi:putative redox protein|nr:OsmC family protein [Dethiobacter sp.]MCL4462439.1 OsmC family protein [Bacillota bacterium]
MLTVSLKWQEGLYFEGHSGSGHAVLLEAGAAVGGQGRGVLPGEMLLMALGGCTAMDIVSLLQKFKTPPLSLSVELTGSKRAEHPKSFETITAIYRIEGQISADLAWKAVNSSYKKYSVVANSLRSQIIYRVILNNEELLQAPDA